MIDVDAALRLLRNIIDGIRPFDVATWIIENDGTADFNPELDDQDLTTLMRLATGEDFEPWQRPKAMVPLPADTAKRFITDAVLPPQAPPITEPPRRHTEPVRWNVV